VKYAQEYGGAFEPFWRGYGRTPEAPNADIEAIYRLYTTTMLALLFTLHVVDNNVARRAVARTLELSFKLKHLR
jgi:hypothetical protein